MEVLPVVRQLRDLASDPVNRATIVKDQSCLQSLVLFLDNKDQEVVSTSLQALKHLAQYPGNRPTMRSELGMLESLKAIMDRGENSSCSQMAKEVHQLLLPSAAPSKQQPSSCGGAFFKTGFMKNARTITLQIYGMTDMSCRKAIEEALLHVSGVVSFTFNMARQRCIIRCKADLKPATLCTAVENSGPVQAKQVVKKEDGEESLVGFGSNSAKQVLSPEKKEEMPAYLPEDDGEYTETSDKAVARTGVENNGSGWFGSVSSFISKSLYW